MAYFWAPSVQLNLGPAVAGDLIVGRADGNFDRLAIGANGTFLNVSGGVIRWGNTIDTGGLIITAGQLTLANGTAANPSFNFSADAFSGFFVYSTSQIGMSVGGVERVRFNQATLQFLNAVTQIWPGATSFAIRNNANNADNLIITDAGVTTLRSGLIIPAGGITIGSAVTKQMVSRFINQATLNISQAANAALDFGGAFTTTVTTIAGDQVMIRVFCVLRKDTAGYAIIQVDRSGTTLPANPTSSAILGLEAADLGESLPVTFEYWDTPAAGTYTYKPQLYSSDANTSYAGRTQTALMVVEIWR